jgi:hypothetical protein
MFSAGFMDEVEKVAFSRPAGGTLIGGALGAGLGMLGGHFGVKHNPKWKSSTKAQRAAMQKRERIIGGITTGIVGAILGNRVGLAMDDLEEGRRAWARFDEDVRRRAQERTRSYEDARRRTGDFNQWEDDLGREWEDLFGGLGGRSRSAGFGRASRQAAGEWPQWLPKSVSTKAEARRVFHVKARESHPDLAKSPADVPLRTAALQRLNDEWEKAQRHPDFSKLAFWRYPAPMSNTMFGRGFADQIVKGASSGCMPISDDDQWSDRFKGTPLYEQALQLEEQELTGRLQMDQRRLQQDQQRMSEEGSWREESLQRDQFRLQRKQMELTLVRMKHQAEQQSSAEGWQDLDSVGMKPPVQAAPQPGPPQGAPQGAPPQPQPGAAQAQR